MIIGEFVIIYLIVPKSIFIYFFISRMKNHFFF